MGAFGALGCLFFAWIFLMPSFADFMIYREFGAFGEMFLLSGVFYIVLTIGFLCLVRIGVLVLKRKPQLIRVNLRVTPLAGIVTIATYVYIYPKDLNPAEWLVIGLIVFYYIIHTLYFIRPEVKRAFSQQNSQPKEQGK